MKVFPRTVAYRRRQGVVVPQENLLPALELIVEVNGGRAVEVATWSGPFFAPQSLSLQGHRIRQHPPNDRLYRAIEDQTDHTSHRLPTGPTG